MIAIIGEQQFIIGTATKRFYSLKHIMRGISLQS